MEASPIPFYRLEFARRAEWRREEDERRLHRDKNLKDQKDKDKREKDEDAKAEAADMAIAVFASEADIADFQIEIQRYDAATIEALHINEVKITAVQEDIQRMLEQAYVLPDGRRVFKTEDGLRVFDENGLEVEDFDPDQIEEWRTRYETYTAGRAELTDLLEERQELHEYQRLIDETDQELDKGDVTESRFEALKKRLEEEKPDAVRSVLGEDNAPEAQPETAPGANAPAWLSRLNPDPMQP